MFYPPLVHLFLTTWRLLDKTNLCIDCFFNQKTHRICSYEGLYNKYVLKRSMN